MGRPRLPGDGCPSLARFTTYGAPKSRKPSVGDFGAMRGRAMLVAVALLAVGCQHADRSVRTEPTLHQIRINGVPVIRERSFRPGTRLGNGFVVPRGTRLLGAVVPRRF